MCFMKWKSRKNCAMCFEFNSSALFVKYLSENTKLGRLSGYFYFQFNVDIWYLYFRLHNKNAL